MEDIEKLKIINLEEKISKELKEHLGIENETVTEYVICQCRECEDEEEFCIKMNNQDESFTTELCSNIFFLVKSLFPNKINFDIPKLLIIEDKINNLEDNTDKDEEIKIEFPGLSLKNKPIDLKKDKKEIIDEYKEEKLKKKKHINFINKEKRLKIDVIYKGRVIKVLDYGLLIEIALKREDKRGLVHISNIYNYKIDNIYKLFQKHDLIYCSLLEKKNDKRISLTMKYINQDTGLKEKRKREFKGQSKEILENFIEFMKKQDYGPITGIKLNFDEKKKKNNLNEVPDLWEQTRLAYFEKSAIKKEIQANFDEDNINEEDLHIILNKKEPEFLKGQTSKTGIRVNPINLYRNKNGNLHNEIMNSLQTAKERRHKKAEMLHTQKQEPTEPIKPSKNTLIIQDSKALPAKKYRPKNSLIKQQKKNLPIYKYKEDLIKAIKKNNILIVIGETGSGKTTQMTQYILESGLGDKYNKIGCTQPRRIAARSVAKRVAEEMDVKLGREVGYSMRFEDCTSKSTVIKYMTDGMLLREILLDSELRNYKVIILDEAHERKVQTDILFGLLKNVASKRKDFKLIITSATLDSVRFSEYFCKCPVFSIPGRSFPVEIYFSKQPESEYLEASLKTIMQIHLSEPKGDILLFLTGQEEIETACDMLRKRISDLKEDLPPLIVLPVYSALPSEKQLQIFQKTPEGSRKCVIATNIAEASLTIDGIYYVIDPGFAKIKCFDSKLGMDSLIISPISQASADQRSGRAGRTGPGKCYRLYTENSYRNEMFPVTIPEIQRINLTGVILLLKALGINDLINFDFMDKPPKKTLIFALENIYALGALNEKGDITQLGIRMSSFPIEPELAKVLLTSVDLMCSIEVATIVALLSVPGIIYRPKEKQQLADKKISRFNREEGDHLTLLNIYENWVENEYSTTWCQDNFLNPRALKRAKDIRNQILCLLQNEKLPIMSCNGNYDRVRRSIVAGFFRNIAKRENQNGFYKTLVDDHIVYIHPSSSLFNKRPSFVLYNELIMTTREYMRQVIVIDKKWLVEVAPSFYCVGDYREGIKLKPLDYKKGKSDDWRMNKQIRNLKELM